MEKDPVPDPRFENSEEVLDSEGKAIGFRLTDNEFLFKYDSEGGWYDEKGNYYNRDGVLEEDHHSLPSDEEDSDSEEEDSDSEDEEILDQFEQMLADEEEGIVRKKPQAQKTEDKPKENTPPEKVDYEQEIGKLVKQVQEKEDIKEGLPNELYIYFKMKAKYFEKVNPEVEQLKDIPKQNEKVKEINQQIEKRREELINKNKEWLSGEGVTLDFSGSQQKPGEYARYWYGHIAVSPQNYVETWNLLKKSEEFILLEHKSFYALKSKFYLKKSMKDAIKDIKESIAKAKDSEIIEVFLHNLPEMFPISFIFDLFMLSGTKVEDIIEISIIDDFTAKLAVLKPAALSIANHEGYCHEKGEYIWIELKSLKRELIEKKGWFKVANDCPHKVTYLELFDTLALEQNRKGVIKNFEKGDDYRWVVYESTIRRITMFRGETIDISSMKQQCTEKDIE